MGFFEHEIDLGVPASAVWLALKDQNTLFPKILPEAIKSIDVLEGEGQPGSVRKIHFGPVAHGGGTVTEKVVSLDIEGFTVTSEELEGGHLAEFGFTKWVQTIKIIATGDGSSKLSYKADYEGGSNLEKATADTKEGLNATFNALAAHIKGSA